MLTVDAASTLILDSDAGNIQLKDGGNNFMTLSQTSSTVASINIPTSDGDLHIVGNDGGVAVTAMSFDMSAGGAATIANGLTLTDGNLVVANGHGIDFSATGGPTNGSGSSELFDDYEEGTFTPILQNSGGVQPTAYSVQFGQYTKIGRMVHVHGYIIISNLGSASGSALVGGLPFDNVAVTHGYTAVPITWGEGLNITAGVSLSGFLGPNTTNAQLLKWSATTGSNVAAFSELSGDGGFMFTCNYHVT